MINFRARSEAGIGGASDLPQPYSGTPLTQIDSDAGPIWLQADDGVMLPFIAQNKTWESEEGRLLRELVHPGAVFVDVGANVGYFSRLIATHCAPVKVHSFEPHPDLVKVLALNVWGLHPAVSVWPIALGDATGTVTVSSAAHNIGDTRVSTSLSGRASMVAAIGRMDDLLSGRVDVVKIDVQGFEADVLRGMQRIIRENAAIKIVAEFWPTAILERGLKPMSVLDLYRDMGLSLQLVRNGAPIATSARDILDFCVEAGSNGQADLLLSRS